MYKFISKSPVGTSIKKKSYKKTQKLEKHFFRILISYGCVYVRTSTKIIGAKNLITSFVHGQHTKLNIETHAENM